MPRALRMCVMEGRMCRNEFLIYVWLMILEFRGIAKTTFSQIASDLRLNPEMVRKACYRLKEKKFINFTMEQGRRLFTKFEILELPFVTKSYKSDSPKENEVKKEVPQEVTSFNSNSENKETTEVPSGHQDKTLPNKEVYNNNDNNKRNIIDRFIKALKMSPKEQDLSDINHHIDSLGIRIIDKAITLAIQTNKPIYNYAYIRAFINQAKELIEEENFKKQREQNQRNKSKEMEKNVAPLEVAQHYLNEMRKICGCEKKKGLSNA